MLRAIIVRYFPQPDANTIGRLNKIKREQLVDILWDFFKDYDISDIDVEEVNNKKHYRKNLTRDVKSESINKKTTDDCPICLENMPDSMFVSFNCSHQVCGICLTEMVGSKSQIYHPQTQLKICCPLCRADVTKFTSKNKETCFSLERFNYTYRCTKYYMD